MLKEVFLSSFTSKKEEYVQALKKLSDYIGDVLESIEKYEIKDRDGGSDEKRRLLLKKLEWLLDRFPVAGFDFLAQSYYLRRRGVVASLKQKTTHAIVSLRRRVGEMIEARAAPGDLSEKRELIEVHNQLPRLVHKVRSFYFWSRTLVQGVFLVPLALSFILGVYYRMDEGLEIVFEDVLSPPNAYTKETLGRDRYAHSASYEEAFWKEFSNYYFGHDNDFEKRYAKNMKDGQDYFQYKIIIKNTSASKSEFVHLISARIDQVEELPFPWENLIVEPIVEVSRSDDFVFLECDRVGPAIDLKWRAKSEKGFTLFQGSRSYLFKDSASFYLANPLSDVGVVDVNGDDLGAALFLCDVPAPDRMKVKPDKPTLNVPVYQYNSRFFRFDNQWFQSYHTIDQLSEVAKNSVGETVDLSYEYASLKKEKRTGSLAVQLRDDLLYYQKQEKLRVGDPRPVPRKPQLLVSIPFDGKASQAASLSWEGATTSGLTLFEGEATIYHDAAAYDVELWPPKDEVGVCEVDGPRLKDQLFFALAEPPSEKLREQEEYLFNEGRWYEEILTVNRLSQLTKASVGEKLIIKYQYTLTNGPSYERVTYLDLESDKVFFAKIEGLQSELSWGVVVSESEVADSIDYGDNEASGLIEPLMQAVETVVGTPDFVYNPKGVDLWVERMAIDLNYEKGDFLVKNTDLILNPSGYIVLYVSARNMKNGFYNLTVGLNEDETVNFEFEVLMPDSLATYQRYMISELQQKMGVSPSEKEPK